MAIKLVLSAEDIYNHVFKLGKGYSAYEVDLFLDKIIRDYQTVEENHLLDKKEIDELKSRIEFLENANRKLEIDNTRLNARLNGIKESDNVTSDNMDLIKKVNRYETFLYSHGFNPNFLDDGQNK